MFNKQMHHKSLQFIIQFELDDFSTNRSPLALTGALKIPQTALNYSSLKTTSREIFPFPIHIFRIFFSIFYLPRIIFSAGPVAHFLKIKME